MTSDRERWPQFLGVEPSDRPRAVVLPVPYEATTSYHEGTAGGPRAILEASTQVELYDELAGDEPWRAGTATRPPVDVEGRPEAVLGRIADAVASELERGVFVCSLGGEHTVTVGCVRGAARCATELVVVSIDAHADLRDEYQGSRYSHACALRRVVDDGHQVIEVGVRSMSGDEAGALSTLDITIIDAARVEASRRRGTGREWIDRVRDAVAGRNVYLSIDLDGLDPSVVPGVGTPEPGGLLWYETLALMDRVFGASRVLAADVVELRPVGGDAVSAFAAARLTYKILGHALRTPR
ncbi:MAG: agmatinase [Candidatus Eisenbacteria bacterium]|nr:agmatinase [Candidatus Eisenbacteria bacterium]